MSVAITAPKSKRGVRRGGLSLSDYYPKNTAYFYSFPAGDGSRFYNQVPTYEEELVSGRPLICAGDDIKIITFAASSDDYILRTLSRVTPLANPSNIISLPRRISAGVKGNRRDELVKQALQDYLADGELVMAQPFLDKRLAKKFRINPELSASLSDKNNMNLYVPERYLPKEYASFPDGRAFRRDLTEYPLPCVVKVAASSSGDGVAICSTEQDIAAVRRKFMDIEGSIMVEEHIESVYNLCVQFGIPYDSSEEPDVIGFNEQITSEQGDFLGGIVNMRKTIPRLDDINAVLLGEILPAIRGLGWYGVGGIDVLITGRGDFYFIDPNLRMTATYAYVYLARTNGIDKPLLSFSGALSGSEDDFESRVIPFAIGPHDSIKIISLTRHGKTFRFNAAIEFESVPDLRRKAKALLDNGVSSTVLSNVQRKDFRYRLT